MNGGEQHRAFRYLVPRSSLYRVQYEEDIYRSLYPPSRRSNLILGEAFTEKITAPDFVSIDV